MSSRSLAPTDTAPWTPPCPTQLVQTCGRGKRAPTFARNPRPEQRVHPRARARHGTLCSRSDARLASARTSCRSLRPVHAARCEICARPTTGHASLFPSRSGRGKRAPTSCAQPPVRAARASARACEARHLVLSLRRPLFPSPVSTSRAPGRPAVRPRCAAQAAPPAVVTASRTRVWLRAVRVAGGGASLCGSTTSYRYLALASHPQQSWLLSVGPLAATTEPARFRSCGNPGQGPPCVVALCATRYWSLTPSRSRA